MDRVAMVEAALDEAIEQAPATGRLRPADQLIGGADGPTGRQLIDLFSDLVRSRTLDVVARELRARDEGFYTISSAGHEHMAVVGARTRVDDPAFLHYRDGGFVMARARQGGAGRVERDVLLSFCASAEDPVAGGRHKVWGSRPLWIPPQTSTIASHLPKAVGTATAIGRVRRLGGELPVPDDAIVVASFGDASVNHASALAAFNAARWGHRRGIGVPVLFVCEDNGIGISVPSPARWVADTFGRVPGLHYVKAAGELDEVWRAVGEAVRRCRTSRTPVFLHLDTVRLWGHAGSDVELAYRDLASIERDESREPLARAARRLLALGVTDRSTLRGIVADARARIRDEADRVVASIRRLETLEEVTAPLAPYHPEAVTTAARAEPAPERRQEVFGGRLPEASEHARQRTLAGNLNAALSDALLTHDGMVVFGEDVGVKGGVYGVTAGLQERFGVGRVFDTLLDETSILGLAQGLGLLGQLPVPEIQYLAYVHNALDQLRGEACSTSFFSRGQFRTPMVVRIASFAYQKGFGGHFHNDNAIGALRDIPGLAIAVPARGADAAGLLNAALGMAKADGRVVAFLEPIALYHQRDLLEPDDDGWLSTYPGPGACLLPGAVGIYERGTPQVLIVTYGNGLHMSLRAAAHLADQGVGVRVLDLRWLAPLPWAALREHSDDLGRVLVVDECRATGAGIADAVIAGLVERGSGATFRSVRSADTYVPLGPAADAVLVGEDDILTAALELAGKSTRGRHRRFRRAGSETR